MTTKKHSTTRIVWISWLQAIGITLVVAGHSLPEDVLSANPIPVTLIRNLIYSFHMPLFFFVSGFLFQHSTQKPYGTLIIQKMQRLLLPYVLLGLLGFIPIYALQQYAQRTTKLSLFSILTSFIYPHLHSIRFFWFLPVLFMLFVLSPILKKMLTTFPLQLIGVSLLTLLNITRIIPLKVFGVDLLAVFAIYFFCGMLAHYKRQAFMQCIRSGFAVMIGTLLFGLLYFVFWYSKTSLELVKNSVELILAFSGIVLISALTNRLRDLPKYFEVISTYSYQIFLLSIFPQVAVKILYKLELIAYSLALVLMFVLGVTIPLFIVFLTLKYLKVFKKLLALP